MPFPAVFLWGGAALISAYGLKKGYDAKCDLDKAKEIGHDAERKYKKAQSSLEQSRQETQESLTNLAKIKVEAFTHQIKHLVDMHKKYKSKLTDYQQSVYVDELQDVEVMVEKSLEISKGLTAGTLGSAAAAYGALGCVAAYGTAGTGVAISGLSGAAATNATLAWLGGGTLASGGFGITGGMVALGGIALAPLLAIGGFWLAGKAEEALTKAREYEAKVDVAVEDIKNMQEILKAIRASAAEMGNVITEMVERFEKVKVDNMDDPDAFDRMMLVGKGLKQILAIPVIKDDGTANENIRMECSGYLALGQ